MFVDVPVQSAPSSAPQKPEYIFMKRAKCSKSPSLHFFIQHLLMAYSIIENQKHRIIFQIVPSCQFFYPI